MNFTTRCQQKFLCLLKTILGFSISIFLLFRSMHQLPSDHAIENEEQQNIEALESRPWYFESGLKRPKSEDSETLELWPNEAKHDRILNQLMFVPEKKAVPVKKIYMESPGTLKHERGSQIFNDLNCPVNNCEIISDSKSADAVVFDHHVARVRNKVSTHQVWIFHSLESPYISGQVIQQTSVNWTATYRLDSDLVTPYDKWVYYDDGHKAAPLKKNYAAGKTKKVAWFVSNCHSKNKRLEYAKVLAKYISVDIYGACGNKICMKHAEQTCRNLVSQKYKFYLSFENANCRDYITEKFFQNALRLDVIPIVMGPPKEDYEKIAPLNSFIHVEDFPSPKHLAEYLHYLDKNDREYNVYFLWKGAGEFINTYFMCRLCAMLHAGRENHFYQKITHWWRNAQICTKTFWNSTNRDTIMSYLKKHSRKKHFSK